MGDYDDERPDWREIDRRKDRSGHGAGGAKEPRKEKTTDRWKAGRVKEALDRIFMGDKGTPEHDKAYRKLHNAYGTERFGKAVKAYFDKYGPPDDTPTLILVLDCKDEEIMGKVFDTFRSAYQGMSPRHREDVIRKLSIMALSDKSKEVRLKAGGVMEELKGAP